LVDNLGPWLRATRQEMWIRQLPITKQTHCIGWLLYLAPEYPLDWLHQHIKQDTGIDVELHFHSISDNNSSQADRTWPRTKAIHVDVDCCTLPSQLKCIERAYSVKAKTFPLGIKMQLVLTRGTGTEADYYTEVRELITLQAHFLQHAETRWISKEIYDLAPQQCPLYDTLQAMRLPPHPANQSRKPLFHAISPTTRNDGYWVRYLPQYRAPVKAAIDRLPNCSTTAPATLVSQTLPRTDPHNTVTSTLSKAPGHMDAFDQWIQSRFSVPIFCSWQLNPNLPHYSAYSTVFRPVPSTPSHHKILPWLTALRQQFQDTAWDRWRYCNGVLSSWQEFSSLAWISVLHQQH